jgi:hypothetical protein
VKILTREFAGGPDSLLMRLQPGAVVPSYLHDRCGAVPREEARHGTGSTPRASKTYSYNWFSGL